jgi:hypothetical protein
LIASQDEGKKIMQHTKSTAWFTHFEKWAARATGRPVTFVLAVAIVLIWALAGPILAIFAHPLEIEWEPLYLLELSLLIPEAGEHR